MMPAMVLCAGFGTRLRPLTSFFPKPLLPVGDQPALLHIVAQLRAHGFGPIALNTHHRAEAFAKVVPADVRVLHETSILGTAGGVANAADALGEGDVLVWNGDMQLDAALGVLVAEHRQRRESDDAAATLVAARRACGEGTLGVDDGGNVVRLRGDRFGRETQGADYLGVMVLSEPIRSALPAEGCLVGDALMPRLRAGGKVGVCWHDQGWVDIGTPARFLDANLAWLRGHGRSCFRAPDAQIGAAVRLHESVVAGGVVQGRGELRHCVVLPGGRLRAPSERCIGLPDGSFVRVPVA